MESRCGSDITSQRLEGLIRRSLLYAWTVAEELLLPSEEDVPSLPDGYIVSFEHFHEHRFAIPAHRFLQELLHYYKIELQHLNPNGIQHMAAFITMCEGSWGSAPTLICGGTSSPSVCQRSGSGGRS